MYYKNYAPSYFPSAINTAGCDIVSLLAQVGSCGRDQVTRWSRKALATASDLEWTSSFS
jgi:hypothetical protein